jgi:hypothetical protein
VTRSADTAYSFPTTFALTEYSFPTTFPMHDLYILRLPRSAISSTTPIACGRSSSNWTEKSFPTTLAQVRNLEQDNRSLRQVLTAQRRKRGEGKGGGDGGSECSGCGQRLLSDAGDEDEARAGAVREAALLQV